MPNGFLRRNNLPGLLGQYPDVGAPLEKVVPGRPDRTANGQTRIHQLDLTCCHISKATGGQLDVDWVPGSIYYGSMLGPGQAGR